MSSEKFEKLFYHLELAGKEARSLNLKFATYLLSIAVLEITEQEQQKDALKLRLDMPSASTLEN